MTLKELRLVKMIYCKIMFLLDYFCKEWGIVSKNAGYKSPILVLKCATEGREDLEVQVRGRHRQIITDIRPWWNQPHEHCTTALLLKEI